MRDQRMYANGNDARNAILKGAPRKPQGVSQAPLAPRAIHNNNIEGKYLRNLRRTSPRKWSTLGNGVSGTAVGA